ncbi:uncharacterized protein PG998_013285 [Apiospora kogelbergensis]
MGWMSLDELHAAIRQASGGTISQASGLIARPKSSLKSLNFSEIMLFLEEFREACRLIKAQEGIDEETFTHVQEFYLEDPELRKAGYARYLAAEENGEDGLFVHMYEPHGFRPLPEILPSPRTPSLPRRATPEPPFMDDSSGHFEPTRRDGIHPNWGDRPSAEWPETPDEKAELETRSEVLRQAAWDD